MNEKITITHHIVYSTKGGCGKTAFSLYLALHNRGLENDLINGLKNTDDSVTYLIDLDLLGSSLEYSLKMNKEDNGALLQPDKRVNPTFQQLINNQRHISEVRDWRLEGSGSSIGLHEILKSGVYIIPVDASEKAKAMFHVKRGITPLLRYEELEKQLDSIQQSIILKYNFENRASKGERSTDEGDRKVKHINLVYDLPPNADSYTDATFNEIYRRVNRPSNNKTENVILYLVSNSAPMLSCNIDWLNSFVCTHEEHKSSVILVNNDNVNSFHDFQTAQIVIEECIKNLSINESVADLIEAHLFFCMGAIPMELFDPHKSKGMVSISVTTPTGNGVISTRRIKNAIYHQ